MFLYLLQDISTIYIYKNNNSNIITNYRVASTSLNSAKVKNKIVTISGGQYYFDSNGNMKGGLIKYNNTYYYFSTTNYMLLKNVIVYTDNTYTNMSNLNKNKKISYIINEKGNPYVGERTISNNIYYLNSNNFHPVTNKFIGDRYYDNNGLSIKNKWLHNPTSGIKGKTNGAMNYYGSDCLRYKG